MSHLDPHFVDTSAFNIFVGMPFVLELLSGHVFISNYMKRLKSLFYKAKVIGLCDDHSVLCLLRDLNCGSNKAIQASKLYVTCTVSDYAEQLS